MTIRHLNPAAHPDRSAPRFFTDEEVAMKRNRERWDNEGGGLRQPRDPGAVRAR